MKTNKTLLSLAVTYGLVVTSSGVNAAGFQLAEYSATGLGRAYAGEAAMADNASAQWRNPAMLTHLEGTQVSVGAIYVNPNVDVNGEVDGSQSSNPTLPTTAASSSDFAHDAVIPNLYISHRYSEELAIGFALGTNYGMETSLGDDFAATHFGNEASVMTMEANLNLAYRVNQQWSLGGGLRYVVGEGSFGAKTPENNVVGVSGMTPISAPKGTTLKYMEGDDTAFGWQAGTAWQINDNHRIGFAYKSEVELKLEGYATGMGFSPALATAHDNGSMLLTLPASAEIASFHQLNDKFAVHASINWTDWSSFEKLEAQLETYGTKMVKEENWQDNYRFALGATYQVDPKLVVRTGVAYDTSAVSDQNRTITIPETDRTWLSLGASYEFTKQFTLDGGVTYIIAKDAPITESRGYSSDDQAQAVAGQFVGEVSGSIWLIGVQANYVF
ncbi:aromatic hydrocarbon degradation protein [Vibrio galatheae]|uniref:Aromatic hydrocarbon degradation protein n=1 Tax=Vibrio galatheae TaxID=579748 RepID=A0A0F4NIY0_9VIBR|nr:outer membrane protein transport protein [Vibrio galatheae]KJY83090.1 aromatic hydrocarbon degradation protein [Vibrio galatheae]